MKMSQDFEAARPLAQHCAELTERGPRPEEQAEVLTAWRRDVGKALSERLGGLLGGGKLVVAVSEPEWLIGKQIFERIGPIAANSLLRCGGTEQTLLLSIDLATTVALTDRSFGGTGKMPETPPGQLTRSAGLLIDQIAANFARSIVTASIEQADAECDVIMHRESVTRLKPFGAAKQCAAFSVEFGEADGPSWKALIAVTKEVLDSLLPASGMPSGVPGGNAGNGGDGAAAFGAIPMPIEAVLAQFELSLGKLERLAPGDCIPIAVPREVPLQIGSQTLGRGNVGTFEDRMAIRLTQLSPGGLCQ